MRIIANPLILHKPGGGIKMEVFYEATTYISMNLPLSRRAMLPHQSSYNPSNVKEERTNALSSFCSSPIYPFIVTVLLGGKGVTINIVLLRTGTTIRGQRFYERLVNYFLHLSTRGAHHKQHCPFITFKAK